MTNFGNLSLFVAFLAIFSCVYNVSGKEVVDNKSKIPLPTCTLCEFVMKELDSLLSENSTVAEIEAALDKVCSLLPTTVQQDCRDYVDGYTEEIIELLVDLGLKPEEVCTALGFCTPISDKSKPAPETSGNCALCEFFMKEVESELTQNATEEEIIKVVESICTILPSTLTEECDSFIDIYGPTLINLLLAQLDPKSICTFIGVCENKGSKLFKTMAAAGPVKADPEECALCEFIMKELEQLLSENSTEEEIKKALDEVCGFLPNTLKTSCLVEVNKYADTIIKLLLKNFHPTQICREIGLCAKIAASASDDCEVCQELMVLLDTFLLTNRTEKEIFEDFNEACTIFSDKTACLTFVQQYGHQLPELFEQLLSPLPVCQALGVCPATDICSEGPAAWCKSMDNAKLCNAVVHCQRHVWN